MSEKLHEYEFKHCSTAGIVKATIDDIAEAGWPICPECSDDMVRLTGSGDEDPKVASINRRKCPFCYAPCESGAFDMLEIAEEGEVEQGGHCGSCERSWITTYECTRVDESGRDADLWYVKDDDLGSIYGPFDKREDAEQCATRLDSGRIIEGD